MHTFAFVLKVLKFNILILIIGVLMGKEKNVIDFYVLCNRLKDVIRTGWKVWNVQSIQTWGR